MRKMSVYLTEPEAEVLRRLAENEGKSQAAVLREAILAYDEAQPVNRHFLVEASGEGPGGSIANVPEEEYLKGLGEDESPRAPRRTFPMDGCFQGEGSPAAVRPDFELTKGFGEDHPMRP